jgi:hypothetical protein
MDEEDEEEGYSKQKSERRRGFQAKAVNEVYSECSQATAGRFIRSLRRLRERGQVGKR